MTHTRRLTFASLLSAFLLLTFAAVSDAQDAPKKPAARVNPAFVPVTDDPALPRVLLLGDSISMGYTVPVRERLKGVANVHRPAANCGPTERGVANLDKWLGDGKWDVIHFNFGLHDLKYVDGKGTLVAVDEGKQLAALDAYEANLRTIVARLKKTGAKLIWANTTLVPVNAKGRVPGDELEYNEVAARVMKEHDIPTNDLHAVVVQHPDGQLPKDVHFTPAGYGRLADAVAARVKSALGK